MNTKTLAGFADYANSAPLQPCHEFNVHCRYNEIIQINTMLFAHWQVWSEFLRGRTHFTKTKARASDSVPPVSKALFSIPRKSPTRAWLAHFSLLYHCTGNKHKGQLVFSSLVYVVWNDSPHVGSMEDARTMTAHTHRSSVRCGSFMAISIAKSMSFFS